MSDKNNFNLPDIFSLGQWFEEVFSDPFSSLLDQSNFRIDVFDVGNEVVIEAELSNFDKNQIEIVDLSNGLKITARDEQEIHETNEIKNYVHQEKSIRVVERFIPLDFQYESNEISNSLKNGILEIRIPKKHT